MQETQRERKLTDYTMSAHINEIQTVGNVQYELLAFFNREEEKGTQRGTGKFVQAEKTHCFF